MDEDLELHQSNAQIQAADTVFASLSSSEIFVRKFDVLGND